MQLCSDSSPSPIMLVTCSLLPAPTQAVKPPLLASTSVFCWCTQSSWREHAAKVIHQRRRWIYSLLCYGSFTMAARGDIRKRNLDWDQWSSIYWTYAPTDGIILRVQDVWQLLAIACSCNLRCDDAQCTGRGPEVRGFIVLSCTASRTAFCCLAEYGLSMALAPD